MNNNQQCPKVSLIPEIYPQLGFDNILSEAENTINSQNDPISGVFF